MESAPGPSSLALTPSARRPPLAVAGQTDGAAHGHDHRRSHGDGHARDQDVASVSSDDESHDMPRRGLFAEFTNESDRREYEQFVRPPSTVRSIRRSALRVAGVFELIIAYVSFRTARDQRPTRHVWLVMLIAHSAVAVLLLGPELLYLHRRKRHVHADPEPDNQLSSPHRPGVETLPNGAGARRSSNFGTHSVAPLRNPLGRVSLYVRAAFDNCAVLLATLFLPNRSDEMSSAKIRLRSKFTT